MAESKRLLGVMDTRLAGRVRQRLGLVWRILRCNAGFRFQRGREGQAQRFSNS